MCRTSSPDFIGDLEIDNRIEPKAGVRWSSGLIAGDAGADTWGLVGDDEVLFTSVGDPASGYFIGEGEALVLDLAGDGGTLT